MKTLKLSARPIEASKLRVMKPIKDLITSKGQMWEMLRLSRLMGFQNAVFTITTEDAAHEYAQALRDAGYYTWLDKKTLEVQW